MRVVAKQWRTMPLLAVGDVGMRLAVVMLVARQGEGDGAGAFRTHRTTRAG